MASEDGLPTSVSAATARALVVDLDGTLCRSDTLWENFFAAWRVHWWLPLASVVWLIGGRAQFKARLAAMVLPDIVGLPWNTAVLAALVEARRNARFCVLATAANERVANACSDALGLFDLVLASKAELNLKGQAKAKLLVEKFGAGRFDYIGDSRADLPVWAVAARKFSVSNVIPAGGEQLGEPLAAARITAWTRLLRVRHWVKNILVLVAPIAAHQWANAVGWQAMALTFFAFCCVCSGVYVFNDLFDLASDRAHPSKRYRPLASGSLSLASGTIVALVLLALGIAVAWFVVTAVALVVLIYVLANALYTAYIKRMPVFDVFTLAGLYTLRIVAGAAAVSVPLSTWLIAFSVFAFLSLALLKRAADIGRLAPDETLPGRGYRGRDAMFVNALGLGSAIAASLVLALYVASEQVTALYGSPLWLWGVAVVILVWLSRLWHLAMNGAMDDDPVLFATSDPVSWACAALVAGCAVLAL